MTHEATTSHEAGHAAGASAALPLVGSVILALIWGAYTIMIVYEIVIATGR